MAVNSLNDYSTTVASNLDMAGTSIAVGCAPADVGVFMRTIMAQLAYAVQGSGGTIPATWHVGHLFTTGDATIGGNIALTGNLTVAGTLNVAMRDYIAGLNTAPSGNTAILVNPGIATDSTNTVSMILAAAMTKSTAIAWVAGTGNGGLGNGLVLTINTAYHVFLILNAGAVDVYFDTSITAANAPAGTTAFRRIWSFKTLVGSTTTTPYLQTGPRCDLLTPVNQFTGVPGALTESTLPLVSIPTGVVLEAMLAGNVFDNSFSNSILYISNLAQADIAPNSPNAITGQSGGVNEAGSWAKTVMTDNARQIRVRVSTTTVQISIGCYGWFDRRGQDA